MYVGGWASSSLPPLSLPPSCSCHLGHELLMRGCSLAPPPLLSISLGSKLISLVWLAPVSFRFFTSFLLSANFADFLTSLDSIPPIDDDLSSSRVKLLRKKD